MTVSLLQVFLLFPFSPVLQQWTEFNLSSSKLLPAFQKRGQCICFQQTQYSCLLIIFLSLRISVCVSSMAISIETLVLHSVLHHCWCPVLLFLIGWGMHCIIWEGQGCGWRKYVSSELPWDQCLGSYLLIRSTVQCFLPSFGTGLQRNWKIFIIGPCLL